MFSNLSNTVVTGIFITLALMPSGAFAEPNSNQIIYWIGTQNVKVKVIPILPDKHVRLKPQNIKDLTLIKSQAQNDIITMQETRKYTFKYYYETDISCDASITYTWRRFGSNYDLKAIIVDCQV